MTAAWRVDPTHVEAIMAYLRKRFPGREVEHISGPDDETPDQALRQRFRVRRRARSLLLDVGRAALDDLVNVPRIAAFLVNQQVAEGMERGSAGSMTVVAGMNEIYWPDAEEINATGEKKCRDCGSTNVIVTGEVGAELITDHLCECGACGRRFTYHGRR